MGWDGSENSPRVLVFTEYRHTQDALAAVLAKDFKLKHSDKFEDQATQTLAVIHGSVPEIITTLFTIQTIDALFDRPIFVTTNFVERSGVPKASAKRILRALQDKGVRMAVRESSGRRPAILMFRELIALAEGQS